MTATNMQVSARKVEVYALTGTNGRALGLFTVESEWEGLVKLRSLDKRCTVIIEDVKTNIFANIFTRVEPAQTVEVWKASPDIIALIKGENG